ncbi:MAG TPA: FAD-binding oxidoreductase [Dehalococcoidia bacterium]|nr:FAD-binding oxidoreductase [Dehalococcoidia bacterium]
MSDTPDLVALSETLRSTLPAEALSFTPEPAYNIDGLAPALIAIPATRQDVAAVLAAAGGAGASVLPRGGGTQTDFGMPPRRNDVALDLHRLDRLVEYEPADLTVTVEAGMRLVELQRLLGEHGQWLPLDPPLPDEATIGGVLATNASGPSRLRYGSARDLVIGMTTALASGDLVKSGGRVVKNVAGYDLAKLQIGALGTLGVIVQAAFKVAPLPVRDALVAVSGDLEALSKLAGAVVEARLALLGLVLSKRASESHWTLTARFAGGAAAVERSQHETAALAQAASLSTGESAMADWRATQMLRHKAPLVARCSVSPAAVPDFAAALSQVGATVFAYPGVGTLYGAWDTVPADKSLSNLRNRCVAANGALVLEKTPLDLKQRIGVWGDTRDDFALMQRLKQQFDPGQILNPGRFLGGI